MTLDLNHHQRQILGAMGVEIWELRTDKPGRVVLNDDYQEGIPHSSAGDWTELQQQVKTCELCCLSTSRINTVFGSGNQQADWLFIGEAPGVEEDRQGQPFVGPAGQLLTAMIKAVGFERDQVYIANVLKCRPPDNRDPMGTEVQSCKSYLHQQISLIQPKIIIALGKFSAQSLLKSNHPVGKMRGVVHDYGEKKIPLVVTYHPAYLLRRPLEKRRAWKDLCLAMSVDHAAL